MPQLRRRAGLAQKAKPRRLITEILLADDFQCHGAVQIDVDRLVGDAHRAATQLERFAVFTVDQLIVLKSLRCLFRCCRLDRFLERRLNPVSKSLAKHADWTEFNCSRKLITTDRAGASVLRFHGPNRPSVAIRASQRAWISSSISAGSDTVRPTSSRNSAVYCFRNRWISVLTPLRIDFIEPNNGTMQR